jgi:hypothetical protein
MIALAVAIAGLCVSVFAVLYGLARATHYGDHEAWLFDESLPLPLRERVRVLLRR